MVNSLEASDLSIPSEAVRTEVWSPGIKWLSPIFGGLLGSLYCVAVYAGCYQGWYWLELHSEQMGTFLPSVGVMGVMWAVGALVGGLIAGLFAEVGMPVATAMVFAPFVVGGVVLAGGMPDFQSEPLGTLVIWLLVILVGSATGVSASTSLKRQINRPRAPGGIWWPHWLYLTIAGYFIPIYLINTATNIWIDFRLGWDFLLNPRLWLSWHMWVYALFLSWFAAVPTIMLLAGYMRFFEVIRIDSGFQLRKKLNALFIHFLTVPTIAWFLTFAWRWVLARLFSGTVS